MALSFITGGTTGLPKFVHYSRERWHQVIEVKARMLTHSGIDASSRVLVMHPMAPWSIGQVFAEGAERLGASVFPVGLNLRPATLAELIYQFAPTVICGGGRNLLRVCGAFDSKVCGRLSQSVSLILTAGELIETAVRTNLERYFDCQLRDVYGCAELDALAIEGATPGVLHLVPDYEYRLRVNGDASTLEPGVCGEIEVRNSAHGGAWYSPGDRVQVLDASMFDNPWTSPSIRIEGRVDLTVSFADGCAVGINQLQSLQSKINAAQLQLQVERSSGGDVVSLACVLGALSADAKGIERLFLDICADFADALQAGCIKSFQVNILDDSADLWSTERDKCPPIVLRTTS